MIKQDVLDLLWQNEDRYVSGAEIARALSVSRSAVWKTIEQLRNEGYIISSVTNKGYLLSSDSDVLSEDGVRKYLRHGELDVKVYQSISSTNTVLKVMAAEGAREGTALIAGEQTAGRGRMGRSFYSPSESGVYLSLLLRPKMPAEKAIKLTACAAVAVAESIEELSGLSAEIKWVNDVLIGGRKVCGILTEASVDCESGFFSYVVIGIGINTRIPAGDFPEELREIAGAVFGEGTVPDLRCRLAAAVLDRLWTYSADPDDPKIFEGYRKRSSVIGRPVNILFPEKNPEPAFAVDIDKDFSLIVKTEDGTVRRLNSGEVSIRIAER